MMSVLATLRSQLPWREERLLSSLKDNPRSIAADTLDSVAPEPLGSIDPGPLDSEAADALAAGGIDKDTKEQKAQLHKRTMMIHKTKGTKRHYG